MEAEAKGWLGTALRSVTEEEAGAEGLGPQVRGISVGEPVLGVRAKRGQIESTMLGRVRA